MPDPWDKLTPAEAEKLRKNVIFRPEGGGSGGSGESGPGSGGGGCPPQLISMMLHSMAWIVRTWFR